MTSTPGTSHLVSAAELAGLLASDSPPRLLDVRWRLDRPDGRAEYAAGHIPGAVYVDLDHDLASHGAPDQGRHPEPGAAALQDAARRWGLRSGETVVAYDDVRGLAAARAWWLLRRAGVAVRVLDGGLRAWTASGGGLETGENVPEPGDVELAASDAGSLTIDEAAAFPASGVLLDVRAPERYRGETEPLDPVAGHIPGAVNLPIVTLLGEDGTLRPPEELRAGFAAVGVADGTPVAAYCGSGITASHAALVLAEVGIDAQIFPGSWSQWSNTPGRPVATGAEPGGAGEGAEAGA